MMLKWLHVKAQWACLTSGKRYIKLNTALIGTLCQSFPPPSLLCWVESGHETWWIQQSHRSTGAKQARGPNWAVLTRAWPAIWETQLLQIYRVSLWAAKHPHSYHMWHGVNPGSSLWPSTICLHSASSKINGHSLPDSPWSPAPSTALSLLLSRSCSQHSPPHFSIQLLCVLK